MRQLTKEAGLTVTQSGLPIHQKAEAIFSLKIGADPNQFSGAAVFQNGALQRVTVFHIGNSNEPDKIVSLTALHSPKAFFEITNEGSQLPPTKVGGLKSE